MPYSPNVDYRKQARLAAIRYGLDPHIFERQIGVESIGYRPDVISGSTASPAGAQGIAQLMPGTAASWGVDPLRPVKALDAAARHMAEYVKKYGSYENALRAYNAGPGAIQSSRGYAETNRYVQQILNGRDPGHLGHPQGAAGGSGGGRNPGAGGAPTVVPGAPPTAGTLGGLNVGSPDMGGLQELLAKAQNVQQGPPQATPIAAPSFSASRYLTAPSIESTQQPQQSDGGLAAKLAAIGAAGAASLTPMAATQGTPGTPTQVIPGKSGGQGPVGRTLVIGDSLEVGTFPLLKQKLGNKVHGVMVSGKPSSWGIQQLKQQFKAGKYQNVVFDLGTNDATAADLRQSLRQLTQIAGGANVYVSTVNSPFDEAAKNSLIRTYARNHPNVQLIPWHGAHGPLADGIHGDYGHRAGILANALGYQPPAGSSRFSTRKVEGVTVTAPKTAWNPEADPMAPWLANALDWAHRHGWTGTVSSGYRTHDQQQVAAEHYGLSHYPNGPQASNHRTGNAVDVTNAAQLDKVLRRYKGGKRPIWAGPTIQDWVHFSDNGH